MSNYTYEIDRKSVSLKSLRQMTNYSCAEIVERVPATIPATEFRRPFAENYARP